MTDDLISRQAAIDALDFEIVHMTAYCDGKNEGNPLAQYNKGLEDGKKAIEALPSAQPVRHGKWLPKHHYIAGYEFVSGHICSECGNDALNAEGDDFLTDYCPNCGADMRGEQDDESRSNSNAQTNTRARGMGATDKSSGI